MDNYKVKVKNKVESKEVQELFFEWGFGWSFGDIKYLKNLDMPYLYACAKSKNITHGSTESYFVKHKNKELTIPQLRDMVVLKRNDKSDATHRSQSGFKWFVSSDNKIHSYSNKQWVFISDDPSDLQDLKPIKEKEMKEYLRKNNEGKYILEVTDEREAKEPHAKHWIEVPKGCDYLISNLGVNSFIDSDMFAKVKPKNILWSRKEMKEYLIPDNGGYRIAAQDAGLPIAEDWIEIPEGVNICINGYFYKDENTALIGGGWMDCHKTGVKTVSAMINTGGEIIWQRSETESLNDQCVGIEEVRQSTIKVTIDELKHRVSDKVNNPSHYSDSTIECIDAMEAMLNPQEFIGYLRGNMFKYQWRYQKKNGIEDLQKSEWYLKKLIEKEMKNEDE